MMCNVSGRLCLAGSEDGRRIRGSRSEPWWSSVILVRSKSWTMKEMCVIDPNSRSSSVELKAALLLADQSGFHVIVLMKLVWCVLMNLWICIMFRNTGSLLKMPPTSSRCTPPPSTGWRTWFAWVTWTRRESSGTFSSATENISSM